MLQTTMLRKACLTVSMALAFASSATAAPIVLDSPSGALSSSAAFTLQENATPANKSTLLDINVATAAELSSVMIGVGLKRAEQIIKLREQLGGFTELEQLLDVKGIGLKTLKKNEALIRIN